jgi:hypothetical protein
MEAFICLVNTGTTALGPTMDVYTNLDNYAASFATVNVADIVPPFCPYILSNVPEGATTLRLKDPSTGCCIDVPFSDGFNLCEICDPFGFSVTTNPNVGAISVGQLTGGCDPNISNYYLEWYGPGTGSTNMIFTSGFGTNTYAGNYQWPHPLTGTSQIYLYAGQYRPVIKQVELDGEQFTSDYGAFGDCFQDDPFVVLPYTTQNGASLNQYQHCVEFNSGTNLPTNNFNGTVELSGNTNYVPYRFDAGGQADLLRIYFSGANYLTPILIESLMLGSFINSSQLTTEFNVNLPSFDYKTWGSPQTFTKVLCLTGLTRSANDVLLFEISPQGTESPVSFQFCFTQLQSFDCEMCALTNSDYKIQESTVSAATGSCGSLTVQFNVSGCSTTVDQNEDLYKYIFSGSESADLGTPYGSVQKTVTIQGTGPTTCEKTFPQNILNTPQCAIFNFQNRVGLNIQTTQTTRTVKLRGLNDPTTDDYQFVANYYNKFLEFYQQALSFNLINNNNPLVPAYWSVITCAIPNFRFILEYGFNQYDQCNNPTGPNYFDPLAANGHLIPPFGGPTVTVTTGLTIVNEFEFLEVTITGGKFTENFLDTIVTQFPPSNPCIDSSCNSNDNAFGVNVNLVDVGLALIGSDTGLSYLSLPAGSTLITTTQPWKISSISVTQNFQNLTGLTYNRLSIYQYENKTYPLTGTVGNYGVKFSESAITCPNITTYTFDENSGTTTLNNYVKYHYYYLAKFQDVESSTKYDLLSVPILPNGQPNLNTAPILIGSGNTVGNDFTVINGSYFI